MAVSSPVTPLGTPLPDTVLPDLTGSIVDLAAHAAGKALLVIFACNHCPYVRHVEAALGALVAEQDDERLAVVAISSNDTERYPLDDAPRLAEQAQRANWGFPYLVDAQQSAARGFGAVCTPDFFAYDVNGRLGYRGAFDASTPKNGEAVTGADLRTALELLVATAPVPEPQRPSMGCSIKWRE